MNPEQQERTRTTEAPREAESLGQVSRLVRQERTPVESGIPVLDTAMFDHMVRIAKVMASSSLVPKHLNAFRRVENRDVAIPEAEAVSNCFLVVNQSVKWKMDPFAVAQHTYVNDGKIGYEGKLVAAVVNSHPSVIRRLSYAYSETALKRKVVVTARLSSDPEKDLTVEGTTEMWLTRAKRSGDVNESWAKSPDQMLAYRGAREWARRHLPEALLGVWGDDELDFERGAPQEERPAAAPTSTRGASGLREAMKTTGDVVDVPAGEAAATTDAPPIATKEKEPGSVERRDALVQSFADCADTDILALAMDLGNAYSWTEPDAAVIKAAYDARFAELSK